MTASGGAELVAIQIDPFAGNWLFQGLENMKSGHGTLILRIKLWCDRSLAYQIMCAFSVLKYCSTVLSAL